MRRIDIVLKFTLVGRLFVRYILKLHSSVACGATQVRQNPVEVTNPKHEKYFRKKKRKKELTGGAKRVDDTFQSWKTMSG